MAPTDHDMEAQVRGALGGGTQTIVRVLVFLCQETRGILQQNDDLKEPGDEKAGKYNKYNYYNINYDI